MAESTASQIIDAIGGAGNVKSLTHCATRLRFELVDAGKVDQHRLDTMKGVLGAVPQAGDRYQVVIGGAVASMYEEIMHLPAMANVGTAKKMTDAEVKAAERAKARGKVAWLDSFFEYLADSFRPILGVLLGASIIIALVNLFISLGVIANDEANTSLMFIKAIWKGVFYFLPIMVAYNAAKKLKVDPWLGGAIMAMLMTPQFTALSDTKTWGDAVQCVENATLGTTDCTATVFGLPMQLSDYSGNVFVPLMMAAVLALVYHGLKKIIPDSVQLVFVPFFSMIIVGVLTAFLIGPLGVWVGNGLGVVLAWMNGHAPFIFAIAIPLLYPFLVPLGLHWPLNALMLMNIQSMGYDFIQGPMGVWNFACFGATAGVLALAVRDRDSAMRQTALSALLAGLLGGVSELSLYGIHLQHRRIYRWLLAGCAAGGVSSAVLSGLFPSVLPDGQTVHGVTTTAFAFSSLLTIPVFDRAWVYASSIAVAFVVAMTLVVVFDYRTPQDTGPFAKPGRSADGTVHDAPMPDAPISGEGPSGAVSADVDAGTSGMQSSHAVLAPVSGTLVGLDTIGDPVFASKALGEGIGVMPSGRDGMMTVCAPVAGMLKTVSRTGHAFGIKTDDNVEVLVHVGLDTADMDGESFVLQVGKGDAVQAGEPVMQVDRHAVAESGRSMVVVVTVVNSAAMTSVTPLLTVPANGTPLGRGNLSQGESDMSERQTRTVRVGDPIIDVER